MNRIDGPPRLLILGKCSHPPEAYSHPPSIEFYWIEMLKKPKQFFEKKPEKIVIINTNGLKVTIIFTFKSTSTEPHTGLLIFSAFRFYRGAPPPSIEK